MAKPALTTRFLKPMLVAVLLLCLCLAGLVLLATGTDFEIRILTSNPMLLPAIALQILATALFIKAWQTIVRLQHEIDYGFAECTAHVGITLLGKYLPGKIWGLVGRSLLLTRRGQSLRVSMSLLLADQFVTFYTGGAIGAVALAALYSVPLAVVTGLCSLAIIPVLLRYYAPLLGWLLRHLKFLTRRFAVAEPGPDFGLDRAQFARAFLVYTLHWLAAVAVLWLLFYPMLAGNPLPGMLAITAAIPLAMLSGFLAVWAPGGIGVREGVIVAVLSLQLSLEQALTIAICYRLICIAVDLVTGALALLYLGNAGRGLLDAATDPD